MASNYFISFEEDADTDAIVIDTKENQNIKINMRKNYIQEKILMMTTK